MGLLQSRVHHAGPDRRGRQRASRSAATCASACSARSAWSTPTSPGPSGCGPAWPPATRCAPRGLKAVTDREIVTAGGGSVYSTTSDMARYAAALLGGGANDARLGAQARDAGRHVRAPLPARSADTGHGPGVLPRRGRRAPDRRSRRDLDRLPLRHGARSGRGHRRPRVRQHRAVQPPRRGGARRERGPARASSASPRTPCAPTSPSIPGPGGSCAAGTPSGPACSPTPSPGCSAPTSEVAVRRGHLTIRGQIPVPAVRRGLRLHPDGDDPVRLPHRPPRVRVGHHSRRVQPRPRRPRDGPAPRRPATVPPEVARHPKPQAMGHHRAGRRGHRARHPQVPQGACWLRSSPRLPRPDRRGWGPGQAGRGIPGCCAGCR